MKTTISFISVVCILIGCEPAKHTKEKATNKFSNTVLREIQTYQDERSTEKLLPFLESEDLACKKEAILAFASVQDSVAAPKLIELLSEEEPEIRKAAAYSLGQIGSSFYAVDLAKKVDGENDSEVKREMIEALGKCANDSTLNYLSGFVPSNATEKEGLAWGMYRAGLIGKFSDESIRKTSTLLSNENSEQTRLGAAHFFGRTRGIKIDDYDSLLIDVLSQEENVFVRMALVNGLGKIQKNNVKNELLNILKSGGDYRVQINALRALGHQNIDAIDNVVWDKLKNSNTNLALASANFINGKAEAMDYDKAAEWTDEAINWRVRATLLQKAISLASDKTAATAKALDLYNKSQNKYERAVLLTALGKDLDQHELIAKETFDSGDKVLATYGLGALSEMRMLEKFPKELEAQFADYFKSAIETGDVALIGIAASMIRNKDLNFQEAYDDYGFIVNALSGLTLPQDIETYIELQRTIDFLKGNETETETSAPFNHPIDWSLVENISQGQKMIISTDKGDIEIELLINEAPASASNFYALAKKGFYDGKNFHRIVPNFVAQGGCPRGDGWGSSAYSIRSEFAPLNYAEGYIGMASAGKDTESCQWFITHSPTPHLDGRYSIFARVVDGMDVVHKLEMGDQIHQVAKLKK